jgi:hypothetical protein
MRTLLTLLALIAGCAGDPPGDDGRCTGKLYDRCVDEHDCSSMNCFTFTTGGFEACTTGCTPGDDTPCMTTSDGKKATCSAAGICTPPSPNPCTLPH